MLLGLQGAPVVRQAVGPGGHLAVDGEASLVWSLQQGEAAEGHGGLLVAGQRGPGLQETVVVGTHVAVQEQQAGPARRRGQAVAADGTTLVRSQGDQSDGQGEGVDLGGQAGS
ncbi:hypothetical protein D3C72_2005340 [compost metagenome]